MCSAKWAFKALIAVAGGGIVEPHQAVGVVVARRSGELGLLTIASVLDLADLLLEGGVEDWIVRLPRLRWNGRAEGPGG
jgi:hypothetical protein